MTDLLLPSTIFPPDVRVGSQVPRVRSVPHYSRGLGAEVVDFMAEIGRPLDPWQAAIVTDAFGLRSDGRWSAFELAVLLSRQNGKGGVTEAIELAGLFLFKDQLIMHSAHLFKTAKMSFQRLVDIIDGSDWLTRRVRRVTRSRGDEAIILTPAAGGGQLLCFSRGSGSGRGFTGDKTVFDEAAYLTIDQYAAATPTLATVPNPQIIYTGTPPDEDVGPMPDNAMLPSVRRRGHLGGVRVALYEWSPTRGFDPTDREVWYDCNPALGIRIQEWFLAQQLENFTAAGKPAKFSTEHLGDWPPDAHSQWQVVTEDQWLASQDAYSTAADPLCFAVDVTPDRSRAAVAAAGMRADGDLHVEVVDHRLGTGWVVERCKALDERWEPCRWVVDPGGPAASLVPDLKAAGLEITPMKVRDVAAAFGMVYDGLTRTKDAKRLWHRDDPRLSAAMAGAIRRRVGSEGSSWDRRSTSVDLSPLVALTNAVWGFTTRPAGISFEPWVLYA